MSDRKNRLAEILEETAERLEGGARYEWGHMGRCNCGHVLQTITRLSPADIRRSAGERLGEWTEHANDFCDASGGRVSDLVETMVGVGLSTDDIVHLEHLSDERVLRSLPGGKRYLERNRREDVAVYLRTMAGVVRE